MTTTSFIIEILVVGLMTIASVLCLLLSIGTIELSEILSFIRVNKDITKILALPCLAVTYYAGWLVNMTTYYMVNNDKLRGKIIETVHFGEDQYRTVEATVLHLGFQGLIEDLRMEKGLVRLGRCGLLIFTIFYIDCVFYVNNYVSSSFKAICLITSTSMIPFASYLIWHYSLRRYIHRLSISYRYLVSTNPNWKGKLPSMKSTSESKTDISIFRIVFIFWISTLILTVILLFFIIPLVIKIQRL